MSNLNLGCSARADDAMRPIDAKAKAKAMAARLAFSVQEERHEDPVGRLEQDGLSVPQRAVDAQRQVERISGAEASR